MLGMQLCYALACRFLVLMISLLGVVYLYTEDTARSLPWTQRCSMPSATAKTPKSEHGAAATRAALDETPG